MTQYQIIYDNLSDNLAAKVEAKMRDGWKPQGGVSGMPDINGTFNFIQAMVR